MREQRRKPSVTIAVCAYNETKNILPFLHSVLGQAQESYSLKEILIVSDGSTDSTVSKVKSMKEKKIRVINFALRMGKSYRLNEIYSSVSSDILVQSDCDVVFARADTIDNLIAPLLSNKHVGMTGGNPLPKSAKTFVEYAINKTCEAYILFRKKVRSGNNVFSADGRLLAFRKNVYKNAHIPVDMIANDMFMYFYTLTRKFEYRFAEKAVVHFRSPQTIKDHIKQNTRFRAAPMRMERFYDQKLVQYETSIPLSVSMPVVLRQFFISPFACMFIVLLNFYCKLNALLVEKNLSALWPMAVSTKSI